MGRFRAMGVVGLLLVGLTGCSLVGVPGLFLNAKSIYTASPVVIPYTFNGPAGAAWCQYTLLKLEPGPSPYIQVGAPVTRSLSSSGNLVIDVAGMSGSSVVDGNYQLTFGILSSSNSQYAIPTLTQTVQFSVQTGPYIQSTSPLVLPVGTTTLTLYGWNLSGSSVSVGTVSGSTTVSGTVVAGSSSSTQLTLSPVSTTGAGLAYIVVNTGSAVSPPYLIPVEPTGISLTLTQVTPNYGSTTDSALPVVIQGTDFTPYTSISILDGNQNPVPFTVKDFSGGSLGNGYSSYFVLSVNLSHAAPGAGSITLSANDGTLTSVSQLFSIGG